MGTTSGSATTTIYWYGLDLLAQSNGSTEDYFQYDGLGSVRQLTGDTGLVLYTDTFDPYGNLYANAGTEGQTNFAFTGEHQDGNGLLFLRARYYNASMGRFSQTDPSRTERNPYLYGLSNPLVYVDPTGLLPCDMLSGTYLDRCLGGIKRRVELLATAGYERAKNGEPGFGLAADFISYYLSAKGGAIWVAPSRFGNKILDYMGNTVAQRVPTSSALRDELYSRVTQVFCTTGDIFGFQVDIPIEENWNDDTLLASGADWGYHSALGRAGYHSYIPSVVEVVPGHEALIYVTTQVEIYDHYDWCFGSKCPATGPQGPTIVPGVTYVVYVGEFFALENNGWAKQFDWYSSFTVTTRLRVVISAAWIKIVQADYLGWTDNGGYADFSTLPTMYTKQLNPIPHQNVCDNWGEKDAHQYCPGEP